MKTRPRPGAFAFGLRGRIVGAVLVTTVATLGVAALALLGPLEQSLRNAELKTLTKGLKGATTPFRRLALPYIAYTAVAPAAPGTKLAQDQQKGADARTALKNQRQALAGRIGGFVNVLGYPDATGQGYVVSPPEPDEAAAGPYDDATAAFLTNREQRGFGTIDGTEYARVTLPFTADGAHYVLAVRKPLNEIPSVIRVVRKAFLEAALAGLVLTLILAIPLAGRIVRRLRQLRQAAMRVAAEGPSGVDVPVDRARDEVGDLARTFAIMQGRLRRQEEARRAFVATASHELRTPLASLDGMLELLEDDLRSGTPDLDDAAALLDRARVQSRRLGRLAADLLDLSRLDAKVELRSEPVELGELSRAVLAEFELGTAARGITTELGDSPRSVWALGDPGSVARILRILLDNAVRMSPDGGTVTVELRNGERAFLSVCDDGPGVPADERELIFERFKRGRDTAGPA
jgi:signal transduction histidine kinase